MSANNTAVQSGTEPKKTEVMRERSFTFVDAKTISLPVAGTFPATCFSVAMIGTYTSRFTKGSDVSYKDYERVGFGFAYIDKNTGEEQEVFAECVLTNTRKSRLHSYIVAMLGDEKNFKSMDKLVGANALITVVHVPKKDDQGNDTKESRANISEVVLMPSDAKVGIDVKDKHIYFDFNTDYSVNGTDKMRQLPKKHLWFIENRSNEYGKNPFQAPANDSGQQPAQSQQPIQQGQTQPTPSGDKGNDVPF